MATPPKDNLAAFRRFMNAAEVLKNLPAEMANYYANGGPGVGQGVVGDRFQGEGNARFEPLSYSYAVWKAKNKSRLNKTQKLNYHKGSKYIKVPYKSTTGSLTGYGASENLPILVLSGATRAAVTSRTAVISQEGDTGYATFHDLPDYAKYLHTGTKRMPKRSPVEPNEEDAARVEEFARRKVNAIVGIGSSVTSFGGGVPRIIP